MDSMDKIKEVSDLIKLMHDGHIKKLECGDIKLELSETYFYQNMAQVSDLPEEKGSSRTLADDIDQEDDEKMLLWSTPAGT